MMLDLETLTTLVRNKDTEARYIHMAFLPSSKGTGLCVSFLASDQGPLKAAVRAAQAQTCRLLKLLPPALSKDVTEVLFTATAAVSPKDEAAVVLRAQVSSSELGKDVDPSSLREHSAQYKEYV